MFSILTLKYLPIL